MDNPLDQIRHDPTDSWGHVLHHQLPTISRPPKCISHVPDHTMAITTIGYNYMYIYIFGPSQPKKNINFPRVFHFWKLTTPSFPSFLHPSRPPKRQGPARSLQVRCVDANATPNRRRPRRSSPPLPSWIGGSGIAFQKSWSHCG